MVLWSIAQQQASASILCRPLLMRREWSSFCKLTFLPSYSVASNFIPLTECLPCLPLSLPSPLFFLFFLFSLFIPTQANNKVTTALFKSVQIHIRGSQWVRDVFLGSPSSSRRGGKDTINQKVALYCIQCFLVAFSSLVTEP